MDTDLEDLVHQFYNFFLTLYNQTASSGPVSGKAFIAFEPIGTAITPETFQNKDGAFLENLELEQFSSLANTVPMLTGSTIVAPSLYTFDDAYEIMLLGSQPVTADDSELLGPQSITPYIPRRRAGASPRLSRGGRPIPIARLRRKAPARALELRLRNRPSRRLRSVVGIGRSCHRK
jgi:hypothetical protein